MDLAPRDRVLDLRATMLAPACERTGSDEREVVRRFLDCRWHPGDAAAGIAPHWSGLPAPWQPVGWIEAPAVEAFPGSPITYRP